MNQILQTKLKNKSNNFKKSITVIKFQLYISIFIFLILIFYLFFYWQKLHRSEAYSQKLLSNYNLTQLYTNSEQSQNMTSNSFFTLLENTNDNPILGIIEIKSINLCYTIFAYYSDEDLKVSPSRFYGPEPGGIGNICILGHNYNNNKFFSNINSLKKNDEIILYDNFQNYFSYSVENVYEVSNDDFSPIYDYDNKLKQLTLITCNNFNSNRIIVRAKILDN